jgi:hypothetical protein
MTNKNIRSLAQLKEEMRFLKMNYVQQEETLKLDIKVYAQQFTLLGLIKKLTSPSALYKIDEQTHISSKILSVVLPMILNSVFFKHSGFITKTIAALVSGKIGQSLDAESLSGIFNMVKSLFKRKKSKEEELAFKDYGIPPDSETY